MQACDRCHSRKTRCDRRFPRCTACEKAGAACLHTDKLRQRNLPRGYVDNVENQLKGLSQDNARLRRELAAAREQAAAISASSPAGHEGNSLIFGDNLPHNGIDNSNTSTDASTGNWPPKQPSSEDGQSTNGANRLAAVASDTTANAPVLTDCTTMGEVPHQPAEDPVTTEVGYLTLKAAGETRYLGSASGIGLASIISSMVDARSGVSLLPNGHSDPNRPASNVAPGTISDASTPPRHVAMPFIEAYFQHTHITFPLLHRGTFLQMVDRIYADSEFYASSPYDAFAFDMVLSIGSSNFNRFGDVSARSAAHYVRAQANLPVVLSMPGLTPLRAILLLSQHGIFSNLRDTSASIWHLVGIGVRICFELGLHLEPRRNLASRGLTKQVTLEEEMKRRCFWCLYNLDRVVSFTLGRPAAIRDEDIDVSFPSPLDDDEFGVDRPILPQQQGNHPTSPFLHLIRIRRISGRILASFYCANQDGSISQEEKRRIRQRYHEEIISWRDDTQLLDLGKKPRSDGTHVSCFITQDWYNAVFNNAMLLLYRPSPAFPHPTNLTRWGNEDGELLHLFSAAKSTIKAYAELHNSRRLNYSWITLHGVFIAGLAYVYCIGRALKDPAQAIPLPDYLEIINDTRSCSNVLVAICERWNAVRSSCELFNRLSNAVIRDTVNAMTRQHAMAQFDNSTSAQTSRAAPNPTGPSDNRLSSNGPHGPLPTSFDFNSDPSMVGGHSNLSHLVVADEFKHYSDSFDGFMSGDQFFPSELLMGFSQDWSFDEAFFNQSACRIPNQEQNGLWH